MRESQRAGRARDGACRPCEFVLLISVSFMEWLPGRSSTDSRNRVSGYQKPLQRAGLGAAPGAKKCMEALKIREKAKIPWLTLTYRLRGTFVISYPN
ncbi:hypothetical protein [Paraburkholderia unamae]|uniref:hypothetical protein n=1 Tax=Paraburkholderia unamae TaxID=219649 RepID=UPI0010580F73|nr:hypothetical protein [Paraburkholderia unamae]